MIRTAIGALLAAALLLTVGGQSFLAGTQADVAAALEEAGR